MDGPAACASRTHIAPKIHAAARAAGRPSPRIVAGLPVAVHDDEAEARAAVAAMSTMYAGLANYQRILSIGGADSPGRRRDRRTTKRSVQGQLQALLDAGATDIWAQIVPVGPDRTASAERTRDLLRSLTGGELT